MIEFSIVVPCYNEADNLPLLISSFASFIDPDNSELIIVDNGSSDNTDSMKEEILRKYSFVRWIRIEKNIGYGNGIYTGLKHAQGIYLGYTHADLQTDPADVRKAIEIIRSHRSENKILVKGQRKSRGLIARLFSRGMEFTVEMILESPLKEINAQPNLFTRNLFDQMTDSPGDWTFDLYLYYIAYIKGFTIRRFDVLFSERRSGSSKWNTGMISRIMMSHRILKYCLKLKER